MKATDIAMSVAGAADAALATRTVLLLTSTMSVENIHAGIELRSFRPGSDLNAVEGGQRLFETVLRSKAGRPFVVGYLPDDLFARRAMMVVARKRKAVIGVAHYHVDEGGSMIVRGLAVHPRHAGLKLGSALVAMALLHGQMVFGEVASIECVIREMPDGTLNEASRASFAKLGFRLDAESGTSFIKGTFRDRHLMDSAAQDSMGVVYYSHRRMIAGASSHALARDFLAEWSRSILQIRPKRLSH